jgi:hypothetical protein
MIFFFCLQEQLSNYIVQENRESSSNLFLSSNNQRIL